MIIKLVRHGQSEVNAKLTPYGSKGDYLVELTPLGIQQASDAGKVIGADFVANSVIYRSPYLRTRQTCDNILAPIQDEIDRIRGPRNLLRIYEDPRLREMDHGYSDVDAQETMRKTHGWFYYRFKGGESPADCYDRCCTFLESMMRQVKRHSNLNGAAPNILLVCHGMTMRCFVARFMHLKPEEFESLANPLNCDIVTIAPVGYFIGDAEKRFHSQVPGEPQFTSGKWGVNGLKFRPKQDDKASVISSLSNGAA